MTFRQGIDGAVLARVDTAALGRSAREVEAARNYAEAIIRTMRDPLVVLRGDLTVQTASEAFYRTFKVTPQETEGRLIYDLGDGVWNTASLRTLLEDILPRHSFFNDFEVTHEFQGIGRRTMLLNGRRLDTDASVPDLILLAIEDITERKRTEDDLHESEERHRSLVSVITDVTWSMDPSGAFVAPQPDWEAYTGQSWEKQRGAGWLNAVHPDDRERVDALWTAARDSRALCKYDGRLWHAARAQWRHFTARATPLLNADGSVREWVGACTDCEDQTRAEQTALIAFERFRFMAESMPQKIFTATAGGDLDYFNPQWTDYTGLPFEQIRGWAWTACVHPDDVTENVNVWRQCVATGEPFHFEHRFRRADGEYRWHISRATPLKDAAGKVLMWVGSNTDINDMKEADQRKDEFLAMLAHELRNPLAPIGNALRFLQRTVGDGYIGKPAIDILQRQFRQVERLVDDLLDVSRISQGKIALHRERSKLASMLEHAVEAARPHSESMGQELTVTLPQTPIYVNADPTRLAQIVGNLLNNASKFTGRGGRIRLTVERDNMQAVIRVQDSGIGIPADQLPRIFDLFMQVDTSLERQQAGLGIGLTLVKRLVEMHDGTIEARSAGLGQGAEFVVRLPLSTDEQSPAVQEASGLNPATMVRRRILVVDDNLDAANSLAMLLKLSGHDVYPAYDGLEAVEAAATLHPDVVLLDIGLPKLNGYEAARRIRRAQLDKGLVLVALTGWGQDEDKRRALQAGFDFHLTKPVDPVALEMLLSSGSLPS